MEDDADENDDIDGDGGDIAENEEWLSNCRPSDEAVRERLAERANEQRRDGMLHGRS